MKVAVIGAGWAGLSAAIELHRLGHEVTVFEAGHQLGGRARGLHSPRLLAVVDNGQHIMLGAYTETLALMRSLGQDPEALLYSMPLALQAADGSFKLRVPDLPKPLALPAALLLAQGMSLSERLKLALLMTSVARKGWRLGPASPPASQSEARGQAAHNLTVEQWLRQGGQSQSLIRRFWEPLCLASMNTPIDQACAQLFVNVLRDSLGAGPQACRALIARVDLSSLWPDSLPDGIEVLRGHPVRRLELREAPTGETQKTVVEGRFFDAAVVATNVQPARRLLGQLPTTENSQAYLSALDAFKAQPIATLTLTLSERWEMPHPMLMLSDKPEEGRFGQWLFHCNVFLREPPTRSRLTVVISNAVGLRDFSEAQIVQNVLAQITEQSPGLPPMPELCNYELITEKRATFAAVPGLKRPANATPWSSVYIAGDWSDTGYPAVLEGAVRSGLAAARALDQTRLID